MKFDAVLSCGGRPLYRIPSMGAIAFGLGEWLCFELFREVDGGGQTWAL